MPVGLVMQGSISKTLEEPTVLCTEQDIDFVIQALFPCCLCIKPPFSTFPPTFHGLKGGEKTNEAVYL